jgi:RimJ/RimL family protein N-acetyltransferase
LGVGGAKVEYVEEEGEEDMERKEETMIRGARCVMVPFRKEFAEELARVANNPNIARNLRDSFPHPYTLQDAHAWIAFCQRNDNGRRFCICVEREDGRDEGEGDRRAKGSDDAVPDDADDGQVRRKSSSRWLPVGGIEAMEVPGGTNFTHRADLGYWLAESHWGRGIMTDAVAAFVRYLFSDDFATQWNDGQPIIR